MKKLWGLDIPLPDGVVLSPVEVLVYELNY